MDDKTLARFWSKVDKNGPVPPHRPELGPCWVWIGAKNRSGYGLFWAKPRMQLAHRMSWTIANSEPSDHVLHSCDNPSCVNPSHLLEGTHADNMADMAAKQRSQVGEKHALAKLSEDDAKEIIDLGFEGHSHRALAAKFSVNPSHISAILHGKTWTHLERPGRYRGPRSKISSEDLPALLAMRTSGHTLKAIAERFGVSISAAWSALHRAGG